MAITPLKKATSECQLVKAGDIVTLIDFWMSVPEAELSESHIMAKKNRPVLILHASSDGHLMTFVPLSTSARSNYAFRLLAAGSDIEVVEYPITNQIFTAETSKVMYKVGHADQDILDDVWLQFLRHMVREKSTMSMFVDYIDKNHPDLIPAKMVEVASVQEEELKQLRGEVQRLSFDLRQKNGEIENLKRAATAVTKASVPIAAHRSLENELEDTKAELENLKAETEKLRSELASTTSRMSEEDMKKMEALEKKNIELREKNNELSKRVADANASAKAAERQAEASRRKLQMAIAINVMASQSREENNPQSIECPTIDIEAMDNLVNPVNPVSEEKFTTDLKWIDVNNIDHCKEWLMHAPKACPPNLDGTQRRTWKVKRNKIACRLYHEELITLDEFFVMIGSNKRRPEDFKSKSNK